MATKTAIQKSDDRPAKRPQAGAMSEFSGNALSKWHGFTGFLSDVRAEMRKVVAPSRKEVEVTTSVVVITVFIFGVFFFIVDWIFRVGVNDLLHRLGGL
jgi:preprotein translocase subunit SecE